jgi:hypothetical protein
MTSEVVYDAAQTAFPAWPLAHLGLAAAAAGIGLGAYLRQRKIHSAVARTAITSAIIFGVSWTLLVGGGLYAQHNQLRRELNEGSFVRVEGVVYDNPPGAIKHAQPGSWVVDAGTIAHWYRYESSPLSVGYRRKGPGTGGLRDGTKVRIADIGGRIARLEVLP